MDSSLQQWPSEKALQEKSCRTFSQASTEISDTCGERDLRSSQGSVASAVDGCFDTRSFVQYHLKAKISQRYRIDGAEIASGGYGRVFKAEDRQCPGRVVAVKKVLCMDDSKMAEYMKEAHIMQEMDHPGICKLFEVYQDDDELYMVMEYLEGGELYDKILDGALKEEDVASIIKQVARALKYAHSCGVAHRDLKPENICFCGRRTSQVKVIDWGLSSDFCKGDMKSSVGSATYSSPEVFNSQGNTTYTKACDLWSLGVMTYVMICRKPPFWGSPKTQLRKMEEEDFPMTAPEWSRVSQDVKYFVKRLLKADPEKRMTIDEVLAHPFLAGAQSEQVDRTQMEVMLSNMIRFSMTPRFFSLIMASAARQMDHSQAQQITRFFNFLDANHDGVLDMAELQDAFEAFFGQSSQEACRVKQIFHRLDLDGSGKITFTEFCAAGMSDDIRRHEQMLWSAFKAFDADDDKPEMISVDVIEQVLSRMGKYRSMPQEVYESAAREIMEAYDSNHDGRIDFTEFKCMVQACAKPQEMLETLPSTGCFSPFDVEHPKVSVADAAGKSANGNALVVQSLQKKGKFRTLARVMRSARSCFPLAFTRDLPIE